MPQSSTIRFQKFQYSILNVEVASLRGCWFDEKITNQTSSELIEDKA